MNEGLDKLSNKLDDTQKLLDVALDKIVKDMNIYYNGEEEAMLSLHICLTDWAVNAKNPFQFISNFIFFGINFVVIKKRPLIFYITHLLPRMLLQVHISL